MKEIMLLIITYLTKVVPTMPIYIRIRNFLEDTLSSSTLPAQNITKLMSLWLRTLWVLTGMVL